MGIYVDYVHVENTVIIWSMRTGILQWSTHAQYVRRVDTPNLNRRRPLAAKFELGRPVYATPPQLYTQVLSEYRTCVLSCGSLT